MAQVKTAISIPEDLFEQVERLVEDLDISRSRLFALAVEELVKRHESLKMLNAINAANAEPRSESERKHRRRMRNKHRALVEGQW